MFGPVPADVIGQPTAGAAQPGGAATEAGTAAAAGQQQDTETVAITAEQQTNSRQNESENAVDQAHAATNQSPANLQEGNDAARGQPQAQQEQATETAEVGAVLPAEVTRALQADMEGSVVDGRQQQAQSAAGKNTEPNALDYTPKQYAEAWLRWSAQINGVSLSEVREMQGDEAGLKAIEQLWVDAVLQEAKSGKQLLRKTLDKFLEVRPNSQLPETAFPDGYQRPEARKIEKEEVAARKAKPLTEAQQAQDGNGAMFSRSTSTKAAYDARIDALFAGEKPALDGVRVLDSSDMLGLLGMGNGPVHLAEGKVNASKHPNMTAQEWKKIPQWLDNPAAVFDSATVSGRLVLVAPETVNNAPVLMVVEPNGQKKTDGVRVHLLQNAYDKDESAPPFGRWLQDGKVRYVSQKEFPAVLNASGLQLSSTAWQNKPGMKRILERVMNFASIESRV